MTDRQIRKAFRTMERMIRKLAAERDVARAEVKRLKKKLGRHGRN
jgi:hypothetical protein